MLQMISEGIKKEKTNSIIVKVNSSPLEIELSEEESRRIQKISERTEYSEKRILQAIIRNNLNFSFEENSPEMTICDFTGDHKAYSELAE